MIEPKNILIVRTDRIGDVVLSLPLPGILKKHFPQCKVSFLTRGYTINLVKGHSQVDNAIQLIQDGEKIPLFSNIKEIKKYKFDSCVIVHPTFKIALILYLSGIKHRIGTGYRWYSFLFNYKIYEHRKYAEKHELEYNVNLLKLFDAKENVTKKNVVFDLPVYKDSRNKIDSILSQHKINNNLPIIIFHPGSSGSAIDLPVRKMKTLIDLVSQNLEVNIILTGSESEKELCRELSGNKKVLNLSGMFDLDDLVALIDKSVLLIANSTGPLHLAAALGKYVIGFYPKIKVCSPERWGPYSEKGFVFQPEIDCKDCTRDQCEKLDCMESIDIFKVFNKIKTILDNK